MFTRERGISIPGLETNQPPPIEMYQMIDETLTIDDFERYQEGVRLLLEKLKTFGSNIKEALAGNVEEFKAIERFLRIIPYIPAAEQSELIELGMEFDDRLIQIAAIEMIQFAPEGDRLGLLEGAFDLPNNPLASAFVNVIHSIFPLEDRLRLIEKVILHEDENLRAVGGEAIQYVPEAERTRLLEIVLQDKEDIFLRKKGLSAIEHIPEQDRVHVIESELRDAYFTQSDVVDMIQYAPEAERVRLIELALQIGVSNTRVNAVEMIQYAPAEERERLILQAFRDEEPRVKGKAVYAVQFLDESRQTELYREMRRNKEREVQLALDNISRKRNLELYPPDQVPESVAKSSGLYGATSEPFGRRKQNKTGSETVLLDQFMGTSLKERVINRKIPVHAAMAWRALFEATDMWQQHGFDYVPIEPIVKISPVVSKNCIVDVYSRVIQGRPVRQVVGSNMTGFEADIERQVEEIKQTLKEMRVRHGHLHGGNFLVQFFKTETGELDSRRPPRVYLIDLDAARLGEHEIE